MWVFVITALLNLKGIPIAMTPDGNAVYMRTHDFQPMFGPLPSPANKGRGGWTTQAECQAYEQPDPITGLYPFEPYIYNYTDNDTGMTFSWTFKNANGAPLTNQTFNVVGCEKVL